MRFPLSFGSSILSVLLVACSHGHRSDPAPGGLDLAGSWLLHSELLEADGPCPGLGIETVLADLTLEERGEADLYAVQLRGIDPMPLAGASTSVFAVHGNAPPMSVLGVYYLPSEDVTVKLSISLDSAQLMEASVAEDRFVTLVDFEAFDGDVMEARDDDGDGFVEWEIETGAMRLCDGRVRMVGELQ